MGCIRSEGLWFLDGFSVRGLRTQLNTVSASRVELGLPYLHLPYASIKPSLLVAAQSGLKAQHQRRRGRHCVRARERISVERKCKGYMDNSCVTDASSQSDEGDTTFKWRVENFSSLVGKGEGWTTSRMFEISGFRWYLKLNPRDIKSGDENEYISLRLALSIESVRPYMVLGATFKFWIYDQLHGKRHEQHQVSHGFQSASRCSGTPCIVSLAALTDKSAGFLVNNTCVFGVELIKAVAAKANFVSEVLFVQKIKNICSGPQVYTWNIEDFFALKSRSNSPDFELCGHKWFITIDPSYENGNYISLFMSMKVPDTLERNSANLVEFSICIKNQEAGDSKREKVRCEFSKNSPRWGFNRFISLEEFKDSSNGYLVKTKCCIEAQVAVIGTSKVD
uniref:Uncharacterized protein n=1 Tax=Avena sativa TaxID=4498 RepID=A0ACD5TZB7_AVESA